jgi:hypothetical protein
LCAKLHPDLFINLTMLSGFSTFGSCKPTMVLKIGEQDARTRVRRMRTIRERRGIGRLCEEQIYKMEEG